MRFSTRTTSIVASLFIAGSMVGFSWWLSGPGARTASALTTEEILRVYATKDSDADGLPDWQEALYGTDPANARSVDASMTDAEAVASGRVEPTFKTQAAPTEGSDVPGIDAAPDTLTDRFGRKFLENYLKLNSGTALSEADMTAFVEEAAAELRKERSARYSLTQIKLSERGQEAILTYVDSMGSTLATHSATPDEKSVYDHFGDFVTGIETTHSMERISELAEAYQSSAEAVMELSVPPEVAGAHLDFANAYAALGLVTEDMSHMGEDPLRGLLGLTEYVGAWNTFSDSFAALGKALDEQLDY